VAQALCPLLFPYGGGSSSRGFFLQPLRPFLINRERRQFIESFGAGKQLLNLAGKIVQLVEIPDRLFIEGRYG